MGEKVQIDYDFLESYFNTELNVIGSTTNTTLRTITSHSDLNSIYVRKFGTDYLITQVTDIEDPIDVNMTFNVYSKTTDTLLGSRTGGGAFSAGSTLSTAEGCYLEIVASGGAVTVLSTILIDTDVDAGGLDFNCPAETVADTESLRLYLSDTSSTYYDSSYMYGGARHTPDSSSRLPYFDITTAIADPDATGFTICTVLDSAIYDEQFSISIASMKLQAALGQTPTITSGVGARTSREVTNDGNNLDTIYVSKTGNDTNTGTYQNPYLTITFAINNMGGRSYINVMDSEVYDELLSVNSAITIESLYNKVPQIIRSSGNCINISHVSPNIHGFSLSCGVNAVGIQIGLTAYVGNISDNNITGLGGSSSKGVYLTSSGFQFNGLIEKNIVYSLGNCIEILCNGIAGSTGEINSNIIHSAIQTAGIYGVRIVSVSNNIVYDCTNTGILADDVDTVEHNTTVYNSQSTNQYGLFVGINAKGSATVRNNISYFNNLSTGYDIYTPDGLTITYSNYGNNSGFIIGAGNITTDPNFCKTTEPRKFGIRQDSGAYRTGSTGDDMGSIFRLVEINQSNLEINGFNFNGQGYYNNGIYILDSADHTGTLIKWCTLINHEGIAIDLYDNDTDISSQILNCNINNNGAGVNLRKGGNTVKECLIYRNNAIGIWADGSTQIFNHNVLYENDYGLLLGANSFAITFSNSVTENNVTNGIFANQEIFPTFCNIRDAINTNVNLTGGSNINADTLFINTNIGSENFNIKTTETNILDGSGNVIGVYDVNSTCKNASDGVLYNDIGAYGVNRGISEQDWKKYVFENNPTNLDDQNMPKGSVENNDALGSYSSWAKAHKNIFPLIWADNQYSTDQQRKKIKYFNTLRPSRELGKTKKTTRIRFKRLPITFLASGIGGVLSSLILTDTNQSLVEDEVKGYNIALKFDSQTNYSINATAKTATSSGAGWTIDQWIGYYFKYNGYSYYIVSNTSTVLTLSDAYSTLVDASNQSLSIEKYFEIKTNDEKNITLLDPDSELVDGTYDYYVDFAMTRSVVQEFNSTQPLYNPSGVSTGYSLTLEQT
jgi:hypothetical protein